MGISGLRPHDVSASEVLLLHVGGSTGVGIMDIGRGHKGRPIQYIIQFDNTQTVSG